MSARIVVAPLPGYAVRSIQKLSGEAAQAPPERLESIQELAFLSAPQLRFFIEAYAQKR